MEFRHDGELTQAVAGGEAVGPRLREYEPLQEWARRNGIPPQRAYDYVDRGYLPVLRLGRRIFVDLVALERLRAREVERVSQRRAA